MRAQPCLPRRTYEVTFLWERKGTRTSLSLLSALVKFRVYFYASGYKFFPIGNIKLTPKDRKIKTKEF